MRRKNRQTGFALLLVMMALVMASILGLSYLSAASVRLVSSNNLLKASRAKYLAESGLQHALYVLRIDEGALDGSVNSPLGPFYLDGTGDSYSFYVVVDAENPVVYYLYAEAVVGGVKQRSSLTVLRNDPQMVATARAMLIGGGSAWLPQSLRINGDFHVNGHLFNWACIDGDASASGFIWDPNGKISGSAEPYSESQEFPNIQWQHYLNYPLGGVNYQAITFETNKLHKNDPVTKGAAITASNPGGVVYLKPESGSSVYLDKNLRFKGTLVIHGDLIIDGRNINLEAVDGFPAIVASGRIYVTNNARDVEINGLVKVWGGIMPYGATNHSSTTINGGLISSYYGHYVSLEGNHKLNYVEDRCAIYDFQPSGGELPVLDILSSSD